MEWVREWESKGTTCVFLAVGEGLGLWVKV